MSDIMIANDNQLFTPIPQKDNENLEASFEPFKLKGFNSNNQNSIHKQIRIVPREGSSASELRSSLKHALQVLDRMQSENENEIDSNFNMKLNNLRRIDAELSQQNDLSNSEKLAQPRNYKIVRKKKFVPYRRPADEQKFGNSQDRTEISLFLETSEKIENKNTHNSDNTNNHSSNLNLDSLQIATRNVDLFSDEDNNVDLDELANSLGFHLQVSNKSDENDETETKLVNVSDFISKDSQGNRLKLGDRYKMLEQLISIAEGDLNNLNSTHRTDNNDDNMA